MTSHNFRPVFILTLFTAFMVNAIVVVWLVYLSSRGAEITLTPSLSDPPPSICPGDTLTYSFLLETNKAASVDLNYTILSELETVGASDVKLEQYIFKGPVSLSLTREWTVPLLYPDVGRGLVQWKPGSYSRMVQGREAGDRQVEGTILIPFEIRSDCGGNP